MLLEWLTVLVVLCSSSSGTLTTSTAVACPGETVTFTCTQPAPLMSELLTWTVNPPADSVITMPATRTIFGTISRNIQISFGEEGFMFQAALISIDDGQYTTTLTTVTDVALLNGSIVQCSIDTIDNTLILPISAASTPTPPANIRLSAQINLTTSSLVTLQWDPPSDPGGVAVSYEVTVSPPGLTLITDGNNLTVSLNYSTLYDVTVRAVNCAGNSDPTSLLNIGFCSPNIIPAAGVMDITIPDVTIIGSNLTFLCNEQTIQSTCSNDGTWSPNPEVNCSVPVTCGSPVPPINGRVDVDGQSPDYPIGATITYRCDDGLFPTAVMTSTCTDVQGQGGQWAEDPSMTTCRIIPATCDVPIPPTDGTIVDFESYNSTVIEEIELTYVCDGGLVLSGVTGNTIVCGNDGNWSTDPTGITCEDTGAPISGTIIAVIACVILIALLIGIVCIIIGCWIYVKRGGKVPREKPILIEMDGLPGDYSLLRPKGTANNLTVATNEQGEYSTLNEQRSRGPSTNDFNEQSTYSALRHEGPRGRATNNPAVVTDEEGYNRVNRQVNPLPLAGPGEYAQIVIKDGGGRPNVGPDGYGRIGQQAHQPMPGYGQLHAGPMVDHVIYDETPVTQGATSTQPIHGPKEATAEEIPVTEGARPLPESPKGSPVLPATPHLELASYDDVIIQPGQPAATPPRPEPTIYAELNQMNLPRNHSAGIEIDPSRVNYATVDMEATRNLVKKPKTLPAQSTPRPVSPDSMLDLNQVITQLTSMFTEWELLAKALNVDKDKIQAIIECKMDDRSSMVEVIEDWIWRLKKKPTWRQLAKAVRIAGNKTLANELLLVYKTGHLPLDVDFNIVPKDMFKFTNEPPPPLPTRSSSASEPPTRPPKTAKPPKPITSNHPDQRQQPPQDETVPESAQQQPPQDEVVPEPAQQEQPPQEETIQLPVVPPRPPKLTSLRQLKPNRD